jgi:hypothetical protein
MGGPRRNPKRIKVEQDDGGDEVRNSSGANGTDDDFVDDYAPGSSWMLMGVDQPRYDGKVVKTFQFGDVWFGAGSYSARAFTAFLVLFQEPVCQRVWCPHCGCSVSAAELFIHCDIWGREGECPGQDCPSGALVNAYCLHPVVAVWIKEIHIFLLENKINWTPLNMISGSCAYYNPIGGKGGYRTDYLDEAANKEKEWLKNWQGHHFHPLVKFIYSKFLYSQRFIPQCERKAFPRVLAMPYLRNPALWFGDLLRVLDKVDEKCKDKNRDRIDISETIHFVETYFQKVTSAHKKLLSSKDTIAIVRLKLFGGWEPKLIEPRGQKNKK